MQVWPVLAAVTAPPSTPPVYNRRRNFNKKELLSSRAVTGAPSYPREEIQSITLDGWLTWKSIFLRRSSRFYGQSPRQKQANQRVRDGAGSGFLVLVAVCTAGWYMWSKGGLTPAAAGSAPPGKAGKKGGGGTVPVVAVKARNAAASGSISTASGASRRSTP